MTLFAAREAAWGVRAKHKAFVRGILSTVTAEEGIVLVFLVRGAEVIDVSGDVLE